MKNINLLILFCFIIGAISCKDESTPVDELSDIAWYSSQSSYKNDSIVVGKTISFMDASVGALSHEWEINVDDSTYFLSKGFNTSADSLSQYINPALGSRTTDKAVFILFSKVGTATVRLHNTFSTYVLYRGTNQLKAKLDPTNPNVWVIDTTFVFRVKAAAVVKP